MNHNLAVGQGKALPLGAGGKEEGPHGGRHPDTGGGYIALYKLHGVVDGHTGGDGAPWAVDIEIDILLRVLPLQIEHLGHHQAGGGIVHILAKDDNAVIEQAGEDVVGALSPVCLLHYHWH